MRMRMLLGRHALVLAIAASLSVSALGQEAHLESVTAEPVVSAEPVEVEAQATADPEPAVELAPAEDHAETTPVEPIPAESVTVQELQSMPAPMEPQAMAAPMEPQVMPVPMEMSAVPCECCNSTCCTKKKKEAATAAMKGAYKGVFYANDFSYLEDPCYEAKKSYLGESLKRLHCDCFGSCSTLDVGGEMRARYHSETNHRGLGLTGNDDDFWLSRVRLFANYRMTENIRVYGEYLYADSGGEEFNPRPIEENRGEVQNLFVDARLTNDLTVRLGRQELLLGAQRLISPLDWANTRRTFDGARFLYQGDTWSVDGFFVHPLNRDFDAIDDANTDIDFFGIYASRKGTAFGDLDVYYLGLNNDVLDFDYHTIGKRIYGTTDGGVMYEYENGYQFGTNSNGSDHSAFFFTAGLGKKFNFCTGCGPWEPTLWMYYDYASGEEDFANVARGDDGFDHLFPLAHKYNGFMDLFGRRNLNDVNVLFTTPILGPKVSLLLWYHYFFLAEATTPYSVVMSPFNTTAAAGSRDLGHEIDVLFNLKINPRNNVLLGYSYFNSGDYYSDTPAGIPHTGDAQFFYAQFQSRF